MIFTRAFLVTASFALFANQLFADAADDLAKEKQLSAEYLAKIAKETGAQVTDQGVVVRPLFTSASTTYPKLTDTVVVAYHLTDREGTLIEASGEEIVKFPLNRLIKCWQVGIPNIAVGSFYKVSCPSDTAYGDKGIPDVIKPGAALTFLITVYGVEETKN